MDEVGRPAAVLVTTYSTLLNINCPCPVGEHISRDGSDQRFTRDNYRLHRGLEGGAPPVPLSGLICGCGILPRLVLASIVLDPRTCFVLVGTGDHALNGSACRGGLATLASRIINRLADIL